MKTHATLELHWKRWEDELRNAIVVFDNEGVDWDEECQRLQATMVNGLASNSPRKPTESHPRWPPRVLLRLATDWIEKKGPSFLLLPTSFREYFALLTHMLGTLFERENGLYNSADPIAEDFVSLLKKLVVAFAEVAKTHVRSSSAQAVYERYRQTTVEMQFDFPAAIEQVLQEFTPPVAAILSSSKKAFTLARRDLELQAAVQLLKEAKKARLLVMLLETLEESLIVLIPSKRIGIEVLIAGIVSNEQLSILLAGLLFEESVLSERPPNALIECASGASSHQSLKTLWEEPFQMLAWTAVTSSQLWPSGMDAALHWLPKGSAPLDIIPFVDGKRVLILDPPAFPKLITSFTRVFPQLSGDVRLKKKWTAREYDEFVGKVQAISSDDPMRRLAIERLQRAAFEDVEM